MEKRKRNARWKSFANIIQKMREGGWFYPQDLMVKLQLPDRTVDDRLKRGVQIGIFKRDEKTGSYAWVDYNSDEEIIREILETWFPVYISDMWSKDKIWEDPIKFIEEVVIKSAALNTGKDPQNIEFRKTCFKVAKEFFADPKKLPPDFYERLSKRIEEFRNTESREPL